MTFPRLVLQTASFTHFGGREYNEDAVGEEVAAGDLHFFVLADGAGGQGGGDVAAKLAVSAASSEFRRQPGFDAATLLRCFAAAECSVAARQGDEWRLKRMASTFVSLLIDCERGQALLANLGDSRCYVVRGGRIIAQSHDHSLVQRFVEAGLYPAEKLRQHPKRNVLYASLGANEEQIEPFLSGTPILLESGDGALLCSDGVWELLEDELIASSFVAGGDAGQWRERIVTLVRERMEPNHDNFSGVVIRCV